MKKIMALLGISTFMFASSLAYVEENKTADIDLLRSQGYSESTLRVVDTVKSLNRNKNGDYQRRFRKNTTPYSRVKAYIDPIQDDDNFGEHQINYTNSWNGDETRYTTTKREMKPIENL